MEAGRDLDLSIGDVVDGVVQQAKGVGVKHSKPMDALSILMQTADDMLEAVRGKSVIEVYINNNQEQVDVIVVIVFDRCK